MACKAPWPHLPLLAPNWPHCLHTVFFSGPDMATYLRASHLMFPVPGTPFSFLFHMAVPSSSSTWWSLPPGNLPWLPLRKQDFSNIPLPSLIPFFASFTDVTTIYFTSICWHGLFSSVLSTRPWAPPVQEVSPDGESQPPDLTPGMGLEKYLFSS